MPLSFSPDGSSTGILAPMVDFRFGVISKQRRPVLGVLTTDEIAQKLADIAAGQIKEDQINLFVSVQGTNLPTTLAAKGVPVASWNQSWSAVASLAPTIDEITTALNAGDGSWDVTKDTAFMNWKAAVDKLYGWTTCVIDPSTTNCGSGTVISPPPGGTGTPPGGTPPPSSTTSSNTGYYVAGGIFALLLGGSILYAATR